ncbi:MAG: MBL fold metallo-hydrolase [Gammaproteobacteria bacterium]|jgi:flavorubredoxin
MKDMDFDEAIAVTRDIHWVGFYDQEARLHCNPYLLIDDQDVVLFDPGSIPHFPVVMRKIIDLVNPGEITHIVVSHQDPDVCGNLAVLEDVISRPDLKIIAHTNTIRLIRHYGVTSDYYPVEKHDYKLQLSSGRELQFLFTPYLHSPGAIVTYDKKTKSLFSSDIFGAISQDWSLFRSDDFLEPMRRWHELYMPSNRILAECMKRLSNLDIDRILPQHGSVLEQDQTQQAIDFLARLPCGLDLQEGTP